MNASTPTGRAVGMMNGMAEPKAKITITLQADVVEQVRAAVAGRRARSVSAYIEHAVIAQLAAEADFDVTIAEMLASSGGAPSVAERKAARKLLADRR